MGSQLALAYASKYPQMVSGLVLTGLPLFDSKGDYPARVVIDTVRNNWQSFSRSLEEVVISYNPYPDLQSVKADTVLIFGNKDMIAVDVTENLKRLQGKKHRVKIVSGTHHVPLEHPKVIADTVLSL